MPYRLKITEIINIMVIFKLVRKARSLNVCLIQDLLIFGFQAKNVKIVITQIMVIIGTHAKKEPIAKKRKLNKQLDMEKGIWKDIMSKTISH